MNFTSRHWASSYYFLLFAAMAPGDQYGRLRLWSSIGWGISALIAGILVEQFNIRWMFGIFAVFMVLGLLASQRVPFSGQKSDSSFGKGVRTLLTNQRWLLFLFVTFVLAGLPLFLIGEHYTKPVPVSP